MESIDKEFRKASPVTFIIILVEALLIAIAINMAANLLNSSGDQDSSIRYNIEISNFRQEISSIDRNGLKDINFSIYDAVWLNNQDGAKIPEIIHANIRDGSVEKGIFKKDEIYQVHFVLDIPELEQTYQVQHLYSTTKSYNGNLPIKYRTMVYCPEESQIIYPEQNCNDRYAGQAEEIIKNFEFE